MRYAARRNPSTSARRVSASTASPRVSARRPRPAPARPRQSPARRAADGLPSPQPRRTTTAGSSSYGSGGCPASARGRRTVRVQPLVPATPSASARALASASRSTPYRSAIRSPAPSSLGAPASGAGWTGIAIAATSPDAAGSRGASVRVTSGNAIRGRISLTGGSTWRRRWPVRANADRPSGRTGSARDGAEGLAQLTGLRRVQLDDQAAATLERDAHDDAASLLGHLERPVSRPRLHRGHLVYPSSPWILDHPVPGVEPAPRRGDRRTHSRSLAHAARVLRRRGLRLRLADELRHPLQHGVHGLLRGVHHRQQVEVVLGDRAAVEHRRLQPLDEPAPVVAAEEHDREGGDLLGLHQGE